MASPVTVTATVDEGAVKYMNAALAQIEKDLGKAAKVAPKQMAFGLCDSLRARTKKAPPRARPREYKIEPSPIPPRYITYKGGRPLPLGLHRWRLTRKLGTPDQYHRDYFVYSHIKRNKRGKFITDVAAEKRELRQLHLGISRAGLAQRSWNWIKSKIYGVNDVPYKRTKGERRNPQDAVGGSYKVVGDGAIATIENLLDYIVDALKPSALNEAMKAAVAKIARNTARAQNMGIEEAKEYARSLASTVAA